MVMADWFFSAFFFILGLIVGSYLNVLILRFGYTAKQSARSACAHCGVQLRWRELLPVISYLALRGRCSNCGSRISLQYPLVEFAVGLLFLASFMAYPLSLSAVSIIGFAALLGFISSMVVVVVYDLRHTLIPLPFVYGAGIFALIRVIAEAFLQSSGRPLIDAILGGGLLFGIFALVSFITKERGLGFGDAYIAGAVGLLLGVLGGLNAVILGVWAGTFFYLALLLFSHLRLLGPRLRVTMKSELPFAPWLAVGALSALFTDISSFSVGQWLSLLIWQ